MGIKKTAPTEHAEQVAIFDWAETAKGQIPELGMLFSIPNAGGYVGGYRSNVARVMQMKREGVKSGVPDICLPVPRGKYHGLFIELKREGGTATENQLGWLAALRKQGYASFLCTGAESAISVIKWYLKLEPM